VQHLIARNVPAAPKAYARLGDFATIERLVASDPAIAKMDSVMIAAVDFGHHTLAGGCSIAART
jgi:hypothetical protein